MANRPIEGADVELYGVRKKTGTSGCFYFGGVLAGSGFQVNVMKDGYEPYREGKAFKYYDITVTMASEGSGVASTGNWRVLKESELTAHEECQR
jgi:hypothetical protein